jgi:hypothetical protein
MKDKLGICVKTFLTFYLIILQPVTIVPQTSQKTNIYHSGWIDFNKNGRKDVYEDSSAPIEKRVDNLLSQMRIEEKTCQLATLYGFGRVLRDELPMPEWKNKIWKDGIGNIDEHLNYNPQTKTQYSYPFGYGLSYTTFESSNLKISPEKQKRTGNISVSVDIRNTGRRAGDAVVQLYVYDKVSSVTVYEKQLRGFERIHLNPGEKKTVMFTLQPIDIRLKKTFEIIE